MMSSLVLLAALVQAAPEPAAPSGMPPEQALASIDAKGNLTIVHVACSCVGNMNGGYIMPAHGPKETAKGPGKPKIKVANLTVTTAELPAKNVEAYTADGRAIDADKLRTLLAKERTVLVAMEGKKVDPFFLQLYKEDAIVLVPPANTIPMDGGFAPYGVGTTTPVPIGPIAPDPKRPLPDEKKLPD